MRIYILRLLNEKWYVGKSKNVKKRFRQHKRGRGAIWTRIHKPIEINKDIMMRCRYDEDRYTKKMMGKYGIENVRGGSYSQINLCDNTKEFIEREIRTAEDRCFRCGGTDHYTKNCDK